MMHGQQNVKKKKNPLFPCRILVEGSLENQAFIKA
jgi:hypothetical protein